MSAPQSLTRTEDRPRKITMVKKLLLSGEPCAKCAQAEEMLRGRGVWEQIDEVVWAKEGDPESPGTRLARQHGVDLAPFFIIERPGLAAEIVESTLKLIKLIKDPGSSPAGRSAGAASPSLSNAVFPAAVSQEEVFSPAAPAAAAPAAGAAAWEGATPNAAEISEAARELRDKSPQEILAWGLARHGANCALSFSGAEDVVLIDMA